MMQMDWGVGGKGGARGVIQRGVEEAASNRNLLNGNSVEYIKCNDGW